MNNPIPPMTHPLGKHWDQPDPEKILIDDTHALMELETFSLLNDYSCSYPSGVYPGKMWKRLDGIFDPNMEKKECRWFLMWYGLSDKGESHCSINYREILIADEKDTPRNELK